MQKYKNFGIKFTYVSVKCEEQIVSLCQIYNNNGTVANKHV